MLAAAPDSNSVLGVLQVVLSSLVHHSEVDISDALKGHIVDVLRSASAIASNPASIDRGTPAEALELALRIREEEDLKRQVSQISTFENIQVDMAQRILQSLSAYATQV